MNLTIEQKIKAAKFVARNAVGHSVSFTIATIIEKNATVEDPKDKIRVRLGALALGSMVSDLAKDYVDNSIDGLYGSWQNLKNEIVKAKLNNPQND